MNILFIFCIVFLLIISIFAVPDYGECCENARYDCDLEESLIPFDQCDNRSGAGTLLCERSYQYSSNKGTLETDSVSSALLVQAYASTSAGAIVTATAGFRDKKNQEYSWKKETTQTTSEAVVNKNSQNASPGSIIRMYQVVGTCGALQLKRNIVNIEFESTTLCKAEDSWFHLADCDNSRGNETKCNIQFEFGTDMEKITPARLYKTGLTMYEISKGLDNNFATTLSPSNTTEQFWSEIDNRTWGPVHRETVAFSLKPGYIVKFYQLIGTCSRYSVKTRVIKQLLIPSVAYCNRSEYMLLVGEFNYKTAIAKMKQFTYKYNFHQSGVSFKSMQDFNLFPGAKTAYISVVEELKLRFNKKRKNDVPLTNSELWRTLQGRCPWTIMGEPNSCAQTNRIKNITEGQHMVFRQLVGWCGEVTVYTDTLHVKFIDAKSLKQK